MPNHVTTVLVAPKEVLDSLRSDESEVDFNTVIPTPENTFQGGCDSRCPHPGYDHCWYTWNIDNWGTKWNAYSIERRSNDELRFNTAWAHPDPVIQALSEKFPDHEFSVEYADEDLGYNLGQYLIQNGEIIQETEILPASDEALDFAARIKYGQSYGELRAEWDAEEAEWLAMNAVPEVRQIDA